MSGLQLDSIPEKGVDYIRDFVPLVRSIQVCKSRVLCVKSRFFVLQGFVPLVRSIQVCKSRVLCVKSRFFVLQGFVPLVRSILYGES